jgi:hypothetical protein
MFSVAIGSKKSAQIAKRLAISTPQKTKKNGARARSHFFDQKTHFVHAWRTILIDRQGVNCRKRQKTAENGDSNTR